MIREKIGLVIFFCLGLIMGLILNFNIFASENIQELEDAAVTEELVKINVKLDTVLDNQELMAKELKRIFARIH